MRAHRILVALVAAILTLASPASAQNARSNRGSVAARPSAPTIDQFISAAYPLELVSAKKAERVAWIAYDRGQRNVYTAGGPEFRAVRVTRFRMRPVRALAASSAE